MSEVLTVDPTAPAASLEVEKRIGQYLSVRKVIKEIEARHEKELAKPKETLNLLTGLLMKLLETVGADSVKTNEGTCFNSTRYSASLADPKAFMDYIKTHEAWDLLDRKANATAVKEFVAEKGFLPPGANLSAIRTINVRRPTK